MINETLISSENLSVGYGKKIIINNVGFEIRQGEILTLIGPNGAGKSTLLKATPYKATNKITQVKLNV